ncbi:MAG: hypothetical protein HUK25_04565 [Treponema sp.]|nr:hypothetical protein [Clostridia bacterium]MCF0241886.1 hypothetical protein [Treponema sp.]
MNKKATYTLIAASLAILIPAPGRFVYGIVFVLELFLLMLSGTCITYLVRKFHLEEFSTVATLFVLTYVTILYKQIFIVTQTEIALTLGFEFFLPTVSSFIIGYIFNKTDKGLLPRLQYNLLAVAKFSVFTLIFFLFRDIFGYGTITFFGKNHMIFEKVLINPEKIQFLSFFATIPGALIMIAFVLFVEVTFFNRFDILKKAENAGGVN